MRILIASGTWPPEQNGVSRVAGETARMLAERGHEVTALVPRASPTAAEIETGGSMNVCRVLARGRLPLVLTDVLESRRQARRLAGPFDVLLAHGSMMTVGLSHAGLHAPLAFVYHASLPRELRFLRRRLPPGRARFNAWANAPASVLLERAAFRHADRVLVLSKFSESLIASDHPRKNSKVTRVSGGVDESSFAPRDGRVAARARLGIDQTSPLLLTVRRAEPRMGIEQLLQALAMLDSEVTLAVVGGGLLERELSRFSHDLGLQRRVRFTGIVGEPELRDWYRAANLFVLPSLAYEGFGMATVEALASGVPVVGTPVGATPELLEGLDARLVAESTDPWSLAAAIRAVLAFADDEFRDRCRSYAVKRFGWGAAVASWEDALQTLVDGGKQDVEAAGADRRR